jgi:hypothetical protein
LRKRADAATTAPAVPAGPSAGSNSRASTARGNNRRHPDFGVAGANYLRVAPANYADGRSKMVNGPDARFISNRIFNDGGQNVFSEHQLSQWVWVWGQFLDHTFGLRQDKSDETINIPFNADDPLESFTNDLGVLPFTRTAAAPGTGVKNVRQQVNTQNSFIDAEGVYATTPERQDWLREGSLDGDPTNNKATFLLPDGQLPDRNARGDAASAPEMAVDGGLLAHPADAKVAGDVRANENIGLTATQTLFAREHNRIVGLLPNTLTEEQKFQVARRIVTAEQQWITYHEFLPALNVRMPRYRGYNANVNATLGDEFATAGYRAHSQIHGEFEVETEAARYTDEQLDGFEAQGIEVEPGEDDDEVALVIPMNVSFFNPLLVGEIQLGPLLQAIGGEDQYNNDEQMDNSLRSVLFQIPTQDNPTCLNDKDLPKCFNGVQDLAALDILRGRDHGMPTYNALRRAFGLRPVTSFRQLTGERTESFPASDAKISKNAIDDPSILDVLHVWDKDGAEVEAGDPEVKVVEEQRRTTVAARLKAIYGNVNNVDAFVGISAERKFRGSDLGELQWHMWQRQFQALRDGDRFFYLNDPALNVIRRQFNIDFRHTLADVISLNTDIPRSDLAANVFLVAPDEAVAENQQEVTREEAQVTTPDEAPAPGKGDGDPHGDPQPATPAVTASVAASAASRTTKRRPRVAKPRR